MKKPVENSQPVFVILNYKILIMVKEISKTEFLKTVKGTYAMYLQQKFNEKIRNCFSRLKNEKFQMLKFDFRFVGDREHRMLIDNYVKLKKTFTQKGFIGKGLFSDDNVCLELSYENVAEIKNKIKYPETGEPYIETVTINDGGVDVEFKIEYYYAKQIHYTLYYDVAVVRFTVKADYKKTIEESEEYKPKVPVLKDAFGNAIHERDEIIYTRTNYVRLRHEIVEKIDGTTVYLSNGSKLFCEENDYNHNITVLNSKLGWMNIL